MHIQVAGFEEELERAKRGQESALRELEETKPEIRTLRTRVWELERELKGKQGELGGAELEVQRLRSAEARARRDLAAERSEASKMRVQVHTRCVA